MRRLPIYFLIDISESMVGEPIQQVEEGLASIVQALKADPYALETVWVSIIVFAGKPKTLVPLQEIVNFYPPRFPIGSGTSLSKGLGHLMYELRSNIVKTTYDQKGDWKPLLFVFTDGKPSDIQLYRQKTPEIKNLNFGAIVGCAAGHMANDDILKELTDNVVHLDSTDSSTLKQFFKWVSETIEQGNKSQGTGESVTLPPPPSEITVVI